MSSSPEVLVEEIKKIDFPIVEMPIGDFVSDISLEHDASTTVLTLGLPFFCEALKKEIKKELSTRLEYHFSEIKSARVVLKNRVDGYKALNEVPAFRGVKNIVAVGSGKGGVGKSSTTVNLALALQATGANVGILDADIYGPNLGLMLGVPEETRPEVEAQKYFVPLKVKGLQTMSMSYVTTEDTPIVWRGPKASGAFSQLMGSTLWHELDYLLFDMPPGTGDIQLTMAQTVPVNGAVIVTTPQNMATQDAQKGIQMFRKVNVPIVGVIENMSTHICSECGNEEHIFGQGGGELLAEKFEVPFMGSVPLDPVIREDCDSGFPTVAKDSEGKIARRYKELALRLAANLARISEPVESSGIRLVGE